MLLKITKDHPGFESFIEETEDYTYREHRRGSSFYTKNLYVISEKFHPDYPELWGNWESNMIVDDDDYGTTDSITELSRVVAVPITKYQWIPIESTNYKDEDGNEIYIGDILRSEHGYTVVVTPDKSGKLIVDPSLQDIPYSLNNGSGHFKVNL